tara:strand:- start:272 stop:838 length:567 start_codon:yes stop_codon:yes gene_type:complete
MRVSIVATSLDGQQPEAKSVINMVHRIQNRNPGYSDFGNTGSANSFNFSTTMSSPITHGANALKLENEVVSAPESNTSSSEMMNEQTMSEQEKTVTNISANDQINNYEQSMSEEAHNTMSETEDNNSIETEHTPNGLENFGVEEESALDLFNSDNENVEPQDMVSTEIDEDSSVDDLEIPAFLRRQKN